MNYFLLFIAFLVVLAALNYFVPKDSVNTLVGAVNSSTGDTSTSSGYILYNHYFVTGIKPNGDVLSTNSNCRTSLQCSNIFALQDGAAAASWNSQTKTCVCYAGTEPLTEDKLYTTIVPMPSESSNNVSQWIVDETSTITGDMICSQVLSNSDYAAAVCAATPGCSGYTYEFDSANSDKPCGCLKFDSGVKKTSRNVRLFTGTRKDAAPKLPNVRYDTSIPEGSPAITINNTTLKSCSDTLVRLSTGYAYASYKTATNTCNFYSTDAAPPPIATAKNNVLLFGTGVNMPPKYNSTWIAMPNTDFNNNSTDTPGYGTRLSLEDAILNCTNTASCQAIAIDPPSGLTFFRSSTTAISAPTGALAYIPTALTPAQ